MKIEIWTDGACSGNSGPGGWAAILKAEGRYKELAGSCPETTNQRTELQAAIEALKALKGGPHQVTLYSDSKYLIDSINQWLPKWLKNGWRNASKHPVANQPLWKELSHLMQSHAIDWVWVKGHDGNPLQERADTLATTACRAGATKEAI